MANRGHSYTIYDWEKVIDFAHILMYIKSRKKDNVKEGVPLPITKVEH